MLSASQSAPREEELDGPAQRTCDPGGAGEDHGIAKPGVIADPRRNARGIAGTVSIIGLRTIDADINQLRERCSPQALDWSSHPRLGRTSGRPQAGSAEPPDRRPGVSLHRAPVSLLPAPYPSGRQTPFDLFGNLFVLGDCVCKLFLQWPRRRFFLKPSSSRRRCTMISCGPLFH